MTTKKSEEKRFETAEEDSTEITGVTKKMNWLGEAMSNTSSKLIAHPIKTGIGVAVVGGVLSERVVSPALNWTKDRVGNLFASGAEVAVEEAVEEEAVAASVGTILGSAGKILGSAFGKAID